MPLAPKVFQFGVPPPPGHAPLPKDHVRAPPGCVPLQNGAGCANNVAVSESEDSGGVAGQMGAEEMLDAISTPSSSDSEEDFAESAVAVEEPGLSELLERK